MGTSVTSVTALTKAAETLAFPVTDYLGSHSRQRRNTVERGRNTAEHRTFRKYMSELRKRKLIGVNGETITLLKTKEDE